MLNRLWRAVAVSALTCAGMSTLSASGEPAYAYNATCGSWAKNYHAGWTQNGAGYPQSNEGLSVNIIVPANAGICAIPAALANTGNNFSTAWAGIFANHAWLQSGIMREYPSTCLVNFAQMHPVGSSGPGALPTYLGPSCLASGTDVHAWVEMIPDGSQYRGRAVLGSTVEFQTAEDPFATWGPLSVWSLEWHGETWNLSNDMPGINSNTTLFEHLQVQNLSNMFQDACGHANIAGDALTPGAPQYHYAYMTCDQGEIWSTP